MTSRVPKCFYCDKDSSYTLQGNRNLLRLCKEHWIGSTNINMYKK